MRLIVQLKFSFSIFLLLLSNFCLAASSGAPSYRPDADVVGKKGMLFSLGVSYFNSTGYYDTDGKLEERTDGSSFTSMDTEATLAYGISNAFEFRLGGRFRQNTSNDGINELSNSGVESYFGGVKYQFPRIGRLFYTVDLMYRASALSYTKVENGSTASKESIEIGDIGSEVTSGIHLLFRRTDWNSFSLFAGYRVPYDDLSDEIVYKAETALEGSHLSFRLGVEGVYSLQTSDYADSPDSRPGVYYGETTLYNGVNRNIVMPYAGLGASFGPLLVDLRGGMVAGGSWTDAGQQIMLTVTYVKSGTSKTELKEKAFKEYDIEASVIKISPRGAFIKIDQGFSQDVSKDMKFDIFKTDYFGGNILVASAVVSQLGADWCILKLTKRFRDIAIESGFTARGY